MARPSRKQTARNKTEATILKALEKNGIVEKYLKDQVDEYMKYYDNLSRINEVLEARLDIDYLKEKRQVTKEMRSILMFLGLKPDENSQGGIIEDL